jgi:MtrB/PioB family decaheme-associated outer membrane protein
MSSLDQSLRDTPLKTSRKTLDAGLTLKFATRWSYRLDYQHQKKDGTRPFGAGLFLNNTTQFPAPVDFTTNQFDMALDYAGERSSLSFGFTGSAFENGTSTITWNNPFLSGPGTESFRADLAPDNDYYQFNLTGAFAPTPKLRLSGRAAIGSMKQDDPLLPYSINPLYSDWPLPRASLDGKIDTSTLNLAGKLTARLARRLDLVARFKRDERDNKTAVDLWTPVITDLVPKPERPNRPYSFKRDKYGLELRWRARSRIRLTGGIRQNNIERSLQSVEETRERTYWGELKLNPWAVAQLRVKLETSDRDASPYTLLDDGGPIENPLMRKFHLAERDRNGAIIELDLSPLERLGISLSYFSAEDEYSASLVGLQESEEQTLSLDLNYAINSKMSIYAFYNQQDIDSELSSISGNTGLPWNATTDDSITTLGVGFDGKISEKVSFGFDWVSSDATGRVLTETGQGEDPFPVLRSDLRNARVHLSYALNEQWGMKIYAEHEKYDSEDWYVDELGPDGLMAVLGLGAVSPDYRVTVLRVLASYEF